MPKFLAALLLSMSASAALAVELNPVKVDIAEINRVDITSGDESVIANDDSLMRVEIYPSPLTMEEWVAEPRRLPIHSQTEAAAPRQILTDINLSTVPAPMPSVVAAVEPEIDPDSVLQSELSAPSNFHLDLNGVILPVGYDQPVPAPERGSKSWEPDLFRPYGVTTNGKIRHMERATIHLRAAGLTKEADRVEQTAVKLQAECDLEEKLAARERLDAEIAELRKKTSTDQIHPEADPEQLVLYCHVLEVSPAKLKAKGINLFAKKGHKAIATLSTTQQRELLDAIQTKQVGKLLAKPKLITVSGSLAFFNASGQLPVVQSNPEGTKSLNYQTFGTSLSVRPTLLSSGGCRLDAKVQLNRLEKKDQKVKASEVSTAANADSTDRAENEPTAQSIETEELEARTSLKQGETLVLGSRVVRQHVSEEHDSFRVPFLNTPVRVMKTVESDMQTIVLITPESIYFDTDSERSPRINAASLEMKGIE